MPADGPPRGILIAGSLAALVVVVALLLLLGSEEGAVDVTETVTTERSVSPPAGASEIDEAPPAVRP